MCAKAAAGLDRAPQEVINARRGPGGVRGLPAAGGRGDSAGDSGIVPDLQLSDRGEDGRGGGGGVPDRSRARGSGGRPYEGLERTIAVRATGMSGPRGQKI
jgi:hypothetical protein